MMKSLFLFTLFTTFLLFRGYLGNVFSQQNKIDSLKSLIRNDKPDTNKVNHLNELGWKIKEQNPDSSIILSKQALVLCEKLSQTLNPKSLILNPKSTTLGHLGAYYYYKGDYSNALTYYFEALKTKKEIGNQNGIANNLCNIGLVYQEQGNYPSALDYYFKALKIKEKIDNKNSIAVILSNIGIVYRHKNDFTKALDYYLKSLDIAEEIGDKQLIANSLGNIGIVYDEQGNNSKISPMVRDSLYNMALFYYFKSLKIKEELNNLNSIGIILGNIGNVYYSQAGISNDESSNKRSSLYKNALNYHFKALKMNEKLGNKNGITINYCNIGSLYIDIKKFKEAEKYLQEALKISKEIGALNLEMNVEKMFTALYEKTGKEKSAIEHYKKAIVLKDTLFNIEKENAITRKEMTYQFEKKEEATKAEHARNELLAVAEKNKQRIILYSVIFGLLLVIVFLFFVYRSLRITREQKRFIEKQKRIVDEKNILLNQQNEEIRTQRDEIEAQRDEIEAQRDLVTIQKEEIEEIHREVTSSINYAKRIQEAVLPVSQESRSILGEHFILFKPKDIVSGDFYWTTRINNWLIIAVADCTGHGVPGAFMSMLGISFLNEIVQKKEVLKANQILNILRLEIINALQQKGVQDEQKDGMDISLMVINTETNEAQWAGANNPLYIVSSSQSTVNSLFSADCQLGTADLPAACLSDKQGRHGCRLIELKGDKMPIAIYPEMKDFTNHEFTLQKGDSVYLFTDGYADQFGGPNRKKFLAKNLKNRLIANCQLPLVEQNQILDNTITDWIGSEEQIDDITVLGYKI